MTTNPSGKVDNLLGKEKIGKLLLKMSLPVMVGMMSHALYNFVDTIFIGRGVGVNAIGGLAITFPIFILIIASAGIVGGGGASSVSRYLGAGEREKAYQAAGNSLLLSILMGLMVTILGLAFLDQILHLFGATEALITYARDYLKIVLMFATTITFSMTAGSLIRSEGKAMVSMALMLTGTALNLILDPILIFWFKLGIKGAAYATVISQIFSCTLMIGYFLSGKSDLKVVPKHLILQFKIVREILIIGSPSFVRQAGGSLALILINNLLGKYGGSIYISCFGVINRFFLLIFLLIFGLAQGLQPIVGYNFGAQNLDRVKQALKLAIFVASLCCLVSFVILMIFPAQMIGLFSDDPYLINTGILPIRFAILAMPFVGFQIIAASFFQAIGRARPALILGMSRQFLLLLPALIILPPFFGVHSVFYSMALADFLAFGLTLIWFLKEVRLMGDRVDEMSPILKPEVIVIDR